tara:strand:+ start:850 stop:969 length:120 start_codon:yes stop_codon:yes gene_type:complete
MNVTVGVEKLIELKLEEHILYRQANADEAAWPSGLRRWF